MRTARVEDNFKLSIVHYTTKRIADTLETLDIIVQNYQFNTEILSCSLKIVKSLVNIKAYYQIISIMLISGDEVETFQAKIRKEFYVFEAKELARFDLDRFDFDNFLFVDKFLNGYALDQLASATNERNQNVFIQWEKNKLDFQYVELVLRSLVEMLSVAYFPLYESLAMPREKLLREMRKFSVNFQVGPTLEVKNMLLRANAKLLMGFSFLNARSGRRTSPFFYASILLGENSISSIGQLFSSAQNKFSLNYFEESELLRSSVKLLLPTIKSTWSLYVPYCDTVLSQEFRKKIVESNHKIDASLFDPPARKLCLLDRKEKPAKKFRMLKVKLLHNFKSPRLTTDVSETFPGESDVVVFVTGGGFVADLEKIAQFYLRELSVKTSQPVFVIKYRVAPIHKFPTAVNDVITGYLAVIETFGPKIKNVTLIGDSAGANLIAGLTNFLVLTERRLPDRLVMIYPALLLTKKFFCPSLLKAFTDVILNFSFLEQCLRSYIPFAQPVTESIFASPLLAPTHILAKYPPTFIFCGKEDPLIDHSALFGHLLYKSGAKVTLFSIDCLSHGFMGLYLPLSQGYNEVLKVVGVIESIWRGEPLDSVSVGSPDPPEPEIRLDENFRASRKSQLSPTQIELEAKNQELVLEAVKQLENSTSSSATA